MSAASTMLRPSMEKIGARIAVSEDARATSVQHIGGEPVVIPNGLYVDRFRLAEPVDEWRSAAGTLVCLGRMEEPRKGLPVLLDAFGRIAAERPGVRLLVAGRGDTERARAGLPDVCRGDVTFLGEVDDPTKARLLRSADLYVAPNTGAESFGIILVEAMAAHACVLASALPSFRRVLAGGALGALFEPGNPAALADAALALLDDPARRDALATAAAGAVRRYDWSVLVRRILDVYETVVRGAGPVSEDLSRR
jgi:phosphatidylinositol alpha-mannosyltransferase